MKLKTLNWDWLVFVTVIVGFSCLIVWGGFLCVTGQHKAPVARQQPADGDDSILPYFIWWKLLND